MQASTGLRNQMLDTGSLKSILALGFIRVFSGAPPATADAAETGTLLAIFSVSGGGTGLTLGPSAANDVLSKTASEVWSSNPLANGTAGYYRHVAAADGGAASTTDKRLQGIVALAGGDMNVGNLTFTVGTPRTIDTYAIALPTL